MSIHAVSWVLRHSDAEKLDRLVLIVLADYAQDDGADAWPSVESIAAKARCSERAVQYALRRLEGDGRIARTGVHWPEGTNVYSVRLEWGGASGAGAHDRTDRGADPDENRSNGAPDPSLTVIDPSVVVNAHERASNGAIKFGGKPVLAECWQLTERVLAEYNRQAGQKRRLLTSARKPSDAARLIYGRCVDYPDITFEEHADIIRRTIASRWWTSGPPVPNVIYGPKIFETNITRSGVPERSGRQEGKARLWAEAREAAARIAANEGTST
jgi:hypothetical protein